MSCISCGCLEYAGRSAWRIIKVIVGVAAVISAIVVFTPAVCTVEEVGYAVAAVLLASALGILIDSLGVEAVINKFRLQISRLKGEVDRLEDVEEKLTKTTKTLSDRVDQLSAENQTYSVQNARHERANTEQEKHIKNLEALNTASAARVAILEKTAREFMKTLADGGDDFKKFSQIFQDSAHLMQDSAEGMRVIMHEIAADKFNEIDANNDGTIDEEELRKWASRQDSLKKKDFKQ